MDSNDLLRPVTAVLGIALVAWLLDGYLVVSHGPELDLTSVLHGVTAAAAALVCWTTARSRRAALVGLVTAALLVVLSMVLDLQLAWQLNATPAAWAGLTALTVRLFRPGQDTSRRPRKARPSVTSSA